MEVKCGQSTVISSLLEDTKRPNGKHEHLTGRSRKRGETNDKDWHCR
jgi:hypothetical protein